MEVILNVKRSKDVPARQRKAWDEFLDMLLERAGAEMKKEKERSKTWEPVIHPTTSSQRQ